MSEGNTSDLRPPRRDYRQPYHRKFRDQPFNPAYNSNAPRDFTPKDETVLTTEEVTVERKHYTIQRRSNDRGEFLKIVEEAGHYRNKIIIPLSGIADFKAALDRATDNEPHHQE